MIPFGQDENIKVDVAHSTLLTALVMSHKPQRILELGVGGGRSTDAMLSGLAYNQQPYQYTLVDNWHDFGFTQPAMVSEKYSDKLDIVTSDEHAFVFSCKTKYDFIMSDADHSRTDQWFEYVYDNLLNQDGILIYHDVNLIGSDFPNLRNIYYKSIQRGLNFMLFNKNSLPTERCERGLMVIFKNQNSVDNKG
jgi:predicted O-methyltransferase YrrM